MLIGAGRVSTQDQDLELQRQALRRLDVKKSLRTTAMARRQTVQA
ncbi:hypothetical protein AF72_12435 [Xylella taiwanensis]|nr:hypothetical protein [Xylella taiwanensis]EWS77120.1 hypothetical protein AF72_12435 [Xylella taiwanensis]